MRLHHLLKVAIAATEGNPYAIWTRPTVRDDQISQYDIADLAQTLATQCKRSDRVRDAFHERLGWIASLAVADADDADVEAIYNDDLTRIAAALVVLGEITDIEAQEALDDAQEAE